MFYDGGYMVGGMHGLWWIFWLALIGVLVFLAWGRAGGRGEVDRETPHEVLSRRLASGEISSKDYDERKALLDRDSGVRH